MPNDIINNLNPIALIVFIPVFDKLLYPALARVGITMKPIRRIFLGFMCGTASMVIAALIQHFIYEQSPCGTNASDVGGCVAELGTPNISVWVQTPAYVLVSFSEIFASITALEYAFTKAPKNMRSLVTAVFLFQNAFSSALSQAFVPLAKDPLLIWLYVTVAVLMFIGGVTLWICFRKLDKQEDIMNALPESTYKGRGNSLVDSEQAQQAKEEQDRLRKAQGLA